METALSTLYTLPSVRADAYAMAAVMIATANREVRKRGGKVAQAALIYAGLHLLHDTQESGLAGRWEQLVKRLEREQ